MARSLVLLALCIGATAGASDDPTAYIGYARQGEAAMPGAGPAASVAAKEHYVSLDWPLRLDDQYLVAVGFNYQYTRYDYVGISSRDRDLHHLQLPIRLEYTRADRQISAYVAPGIATSSNVFKDFLNRGSSDDWYVSGAVEARIGERNRRWLIGAAYDRSFGEARMYPILGLSVSPRDDLNVRIAYPVSAFAWRYSDRATVMGRVMPAGFEWRVVTDDFANEFNYHVEGIRTELHWTQRIFDQWLIDLSAAYETNRQHEFVDDLGNRMTGNPEGEWLFAITFGFGEAPAVSAHGMRIQSIPK